MTSSIALRRCVLRRRMVSSATAGAGLAFLVAGCGGGTKRITATAVASTGASSAPAWQPGTVAPKVTATLIAQAGYGLTPADTSLGTVDEVFGAVPPDAHVNPAAKAVNDQYARFGRCLGEHMRIHDLGHELALLVAYNRKDRQVQAAVEQASKICAGLSITPDANYRQSLKTNP